MDCSAQGLPIPHHLPEFAQVKVKSFSCIWLCNPMDCSPPGSSVHRIFQARVLEWAAISLSRGSSQPRDQMQVSCITDRCFTIWATREAFAQVHVYCNCDAVQPSHPLTVSSAFDFSQHQGLFPASGTFPVSHLFVSDEQNTGAPTSASVLPVNIQGWSPLRLTGLISFLSKGLFRSFPYHHYLKVSILWHSAFFTVQLSQTHMTTGKTIALTIGTSVWIGIWLL